MRPAIIVDLDGTLCDSSHRVHFVQKKPKDWESFYKQCVNDKPNLWCLKICQAFQDMDHEILFVTGRPEKYREITNRWLVHNVTGSVLCGHLLMRPTGDFRVDTEVKKEIYDKYIKDRFSILFCLDDRPQVARMWREIGLTCLQCADIEF